MRRTNHPSHANDATPAGRVPTRRPPPAGSPRRRYPVRPFVGGTPRISRLAARDPVRTAAVTRYLALLERVILHAPDDSVLEALAASDDVGGLARLLARAGPLAPPARDPLAAARTRGAEGKARLLERAGGGLSAGAVAQRMGVKPAAVHARRLRRTLLAVPQANGEFVYPVCQFGADGPLPGLGRVLAAFAVDGAWTRLSVLLSPAGALGGATPLDALARGDVDGAAAAVTSYGEHLG